MCGKVFYKLSLEIVFEGNKQTLLLPWLMLQRPRIINIKIFEIVYMIVTSALLTLCFLQIEYKRKKTYYSLALPFLTDPV